MLAVGREPRARWRRAPAAALQPGGPHPLAQTQELLFGTARELGVEVLVHLSMHRTPEGGARVHAQNVDVLRWFLSFTERHPTIKRLVLRSGAEVYRVDARLPTLITEDHPVDLNPRAPQWVRDRVEADLLACARMGLRPLEIVVLRCAELFAADSGSQLLDYLSPPPCLRPVGFDPMINLLSLEDAATRCSARCGPSAPRGSSTCRGPTPCRSRSSSAGEGWPCRWPGRCSSRSTGRAGSPGGLLVRLNRRRFHYVAVLDGRRARELLGYRPCHPVAWPVGAARAAPPPLLAEPDPAAHARRAPQRPRRASASSTASRREGPCRPPPGNHHRRSP